MQAISSAYLEGNWGPVHDELDVPDLKVEGELPRALRGTFLRIGPNAQFPPIGRYHFFDGDGMVHAVRIEDGRARYNNRWARTRGFELEREAGRALWTGFAEPPNIADPPHGMLFKNVANTAFAHHAGHLYALWEGGAPHEIRLPDLATLGQVDFNGHVKGPFTAHPKVDPVTGDMIYFGYMLWSPVVEYGVVGRDGRVDHAAQITLDVPVMMHDFAVTEHFSILMDLPFTFRPERMQQGRPPLGFEPERPARFGILPRRGDASQIRWFELPACYIYHVFNAWEEGSRVVLLACRLQRTDLFDGDADGGAGARLTRFCFDLETGKATEERLDDELATDFPRVDDRRAGRPTRHGYAARFEPGASMPLIDGLVRYDLTRGTRETYLYGAHRYGGEVVFAPRHGGTAEDDGYVVGFVHDENTGASEMLVLDARAVEQGPIARVHLPRRVPYGFHAGWVPLD
jgi:carotenoid cleavage dioxygenase